MGNPYIVVCGEGTVDLEEQVTGAISRGYIPCGGIAVMDSKDMMPFYQALVLPSAMVPPGAIDAIRKAVEPPREAPKKGLKKMIE